VPDADDGERGLAFRRRVSSLPAPLRTAVVGLLAGVTGGVAATVVDPASTLATVGLVVAVVAAVTWGWLRVR